MLLKTRNISKSFDGVKIIEDINLTLKANEIVGLLGISGVGKSTLFNLLSGLLLPDTGKILLNGRDITGKTGIISYMQQKDLLLPHKKIADNIALPLILKGIKRKKAHQMVLEKLPEFGLEGTQHKYPDQLSGGMRQRAALLRTFFFNSKISLLDEPFSSLDTITKTQLHLWFLNIISKINMSCILITHDIDEAILLSDRIYIMSGSPGRLTNEIEVAAPRPRDTGFTTSEEFMRIKKQVLSCLHF